MAKRKKAAPTPTPGAELQPPPLSKIYTVEDITGGTGDVAAGKNFKNDRSLSGSGSFKDMSTIIICPTRGMIHHRVVSSWLTLMPLMNQARPFFIVPGKEVGVAYTETIQGILAHPQLSKFKFILTVEDDNILPPNAHHLLAETIERHPQFDAVGGLYFLKGEGGAPQCYGDPDAYRQTGVLDFRPRNIADAFRRGQVVPCNGVAMGCTLYKMQLFRDIAYPWFVTEQRVTPTGPRVFTQDLYFCEKAKSAGKQFAIDTRCTVGHLDINTGEVW